MTDWENIILQELEIGTDLEYLEKVSIFTDKPINYTDFQPIHRPNILMIETALRTAYKQANKEVQKIWTTAFEQLDKRLKELQFSKKLLTDLQSDNWIDRFVARHILARLGGVCVEPLRKIAITVAETSTIHKTIVWLLEGVEEETTRRLALKATQLLCPDCLTRCVPHRVRVSREVSITYYGCRLCNQSLEFLDYVEVVVVLDSTWKELYLGYGQQFRVNWLSKSKRLLFEFDTIEIKQATDEMVERFVVQVGNDTNPIRSAQYKQMPCRISKACHLSEGIIRMLHRTFGRVEIIEMIN